MTSALAPAKQDQGHIIRIKAQDDFCVWRKEGRCDEMVFFLRQDDGSISAIRSHAELQIITFDSVRKRLTAVAPPKKRKGQKRTAA